MRLFKVLSTLLVFSLVLALGGEPVSAAPNASVIMNISNPYCVQSTSDPDVCYIVLRSMTASSPDSNLFRFEIAIDGKVRLRMHTFFEDSILLSYAMLGKGLKVACGAPNASGIPGYGRIYSVNLSAYGFTGSPIVDIANVTCPAGSNKNYLPLISK